MTGPNQEHSGLRPDFRPPYLLLGPGFGAPKGEFYRRPTTILRADRPDEVEPALAALDAAVARGDTVGGYLAYELGYLFERRLAPLLPERRPCPLLLLGVFKGAGVAQPPSSDFAAPPAGVRPSLAPSDYEGNARRILKLIRDGDVYQVNLTFGLEFDAPDPLALYGALLANQPVPYPALVDLGGPVIVSLSPELFFEITAGRIRARPMKGTAPRARMSTKDAAAAEALARDPKNRAENLMITDLLRNDLSKIARIGSVDVPALFEVETYRTLHTLTSTVEAELRAGLKPSEILRALFPCGSVTGAPKIRAMEIIRDLEPCPRGVYTGAIGVFRGDGSACFNVAIRTLTITGSRARLGVGGGIVADSDPKAEAAEAHLKARFLTGLSPFAADQQPLRLIETLRWEPAGFLRLERHLARLADSAAYFRFALDLGQVRSALEQRAAEFAATMRVRIELGEDGTFRIQAAPLALEARAWRCRISDHWIASADPYRAHKTTRRGLYDEEFARASKAGFEEVLFLNERGELAEGSRTSIFVERAGTLLTPPVAAGALPGVLRAELLDSGRAREFVLRPEDLGSGALFLGNSLRGLIAAALEG